MCAPDYFGVEYVINPWMEGQLSATNSQLASLQWAQLHSILGQCAEVSLIPPVKGLPDLVFTANAALIVRDTAVLSSFRCDERRPEELHFSNWLTGAGFQVVVLPRDVYFEGAGDALLDRAQSLLWAGHGFRSDKSAIPFLEAYLDLEVQPLELSDPRFYHLDTCFCPLEGGYLLYFPDAFTDSARLAIETRVSSDQRLALLESEALEFSCNAVNIGNQVVLNHASTRIQHWLCERKFRVKQTPLTEFMKAGGAAKCLSLRLDEGCVPSQSE